MEREKFLIKVIFISLFLVCKIWLCDTFAQVPEVKITAPDESISVSTKSKYANFYIEGWQCGYNLAPQVVFDIRTANEVIREITNKVQELTEGIIIVKAIVEEETKKNTPKKDIINRVSPIGKNILSKAREVKLDITDFQKNRTYHIKDMEDVYEYYIKNCKKIEEEIKKGGDFGVLYGKRVNISRQEVHPEIEEYEDGYITYVISDCYTKSDLDVFVNSQIQAYQTAISLFSDYEKLKKELKDYIEGKGW